MLDLASEIDDIASLFGDADVKLSASEGQGVVLEHMYKQHEPIFGAVARDMVKAGWSIFPQEMDGGRQPGSVKRPGDNKPRMIKFSEEHHLATQLPTKDALDTWIAQCGHLNVAVVLGKASGHAFVLDIDVVEETLSREIQELAERFFGQTPLRRVGNWPKMALIYRHNEDDIVESRSPKFSPQTHPENPGGLDQGVEIIANGKPMTFHGKHHKTGRYFTWLQGHPQTHGPETVPVVTSQQVADFMDAVDSLRPFNKSRSFDGTATTWEWDPDAQVHVPKVRSAGGAMDWIEDDKGLITDGREAYITKLAYRIVTANPSIVQKPGPQGGFVINEIGVNTLMKTVVEQFEATTAPSSKWRGKTLERVVRDKVRRVVEKLVRGEVQAYIPKRGDDGKYIQTQAANYMPPQPRKAGVDNLSFLPPFVDPTIEGFDPNKPNQRRPVRIELVDATPEEIEARRAERVIEEDRTRIAQSVSDGLGKAFDVFWDEVYDTERRYTRVHILKAPTGAGKTSRGIRRIAEDPRTKDDFIGRDENGNIANLGRAPILVLMPTYANIEELRHRAKILNLDGELSDHELRVQAQEMGLIHEDDLPAKLAELRRDAKNAGIETLIYQGKIRAGCKMKERVELAMKAGLGTSGFCKAEVDGPDIDAVTGKPMKEEKHCPFYFNYGIDKNGNPTKCPAIQQKDDIAKAHVVFMPHAFLALSIPDELKNVRAVVADERIHHLFLHTTTFDIDVFNSTRKSPKLTKAEKEAGKDPEEFVQDRKDAIDVVVEALKSNACPVEALLNDPALDERTNMPSSIRWVEAARRSCGASVEKEGEITPDIDLEKLVELCEQPTGKFVREEYRFWKIVEERLTARRQELLHMSLETDPEISKRYKQTTGNREMRIQFVQDELDDGKVKEQVRISWREEPNWVDKPLLLLDASAAPEMIEKIWCGKEVVVHDIPAALNVRIVAVADRTYSNASVVAKPSSTPREKLQSARLLNNIRKAITVTSSLYGWSRVVLGGSILVRRMVNKDWAGPRNTDWCHFGAMRGLDFAKYHEAALSVGRMELPTRTIDGLVAALTYDDEVPEEPYDRYGTGKSDHGGPLMVPTGVQRVRLRSGHDIVMPVPMFPGKWGRMIQKQYREEELLQFLGRLRPVYREGEPPIWFNLSSVIPEEVIVDDIINMDDLLRRGRTEPVIFEAMRRSDGILEPSLALAQMDDHFDSVDGVKRFMKNEGINAETGEIAARLGWGIVSLAFNRPDGSQGFAFIRADIEEPEDALRNAFKATLRQKITKVRKVSQSRGRTMARGRLPDTIEDELGTLEVRREQERVRADETAMHALKITQPEHVQHLLADRAERPLPVMLMTGVKRSDDENSPDFRVSFPEMAVKQTMDQFWKDKGYGEADKTMLTDQIDDVVFGKSVWAAEVGDADQWNNYSEIGQSVEDSMTFMDSIFADHEKDDAPW